MRWIPSLGVLFLLACGAMRDEDHRPLLRRLDQALPAPESSLEGAMIETAIWPVAVCAGLVDTFVSCPALQLKTASRDTRELLWETEGGTWFYEAALFLPKVAVTPVVFLSDWLLLSVVG